MADQKHAPLAPSAAGRWGPWGCPASVRMEAAYPQDESDAAREGTLAHEYIFARLEGKPSPDVTDEMAQNCDEYIGACIADREKGDVHYESLVRMDKSVSPLNWGTPDAYTIAKDDKFLRVRDFKYGHSFVDEYNNWQLIDYAFGALETHGVDDYGDWTIELVIHQPRYFGPEGQVRWVSLTGHELHGRKEILATAAKHASELNAPMRTGPHCKNCSARHACSAFQRVAGVAIDLAMHGQAHELSPKALGIELDMLTVAEERIKARRTGLEAEAIAQMQSGTSVPGWTLTKTQTRAVWSDTARKTIAVTSLVGFDIRQPDAILTPAQAKKAGVPDEIVDMYSTRPMGATKLTQITSRDIATKLKDK
jgi:Protein of unknown function (DUF2800)